MIMDFFFIILGRLNFQINFKIMLFTPSVKDSGLSSTLQTKAGFRKGKCFDGDVFWCPNVKYFLQRTVFVRNILFFFPFCKFVIIRKIYSESVYIDSSLSLRFKILSLPRRNHPNLKSSDLPGLVYPKARNASNLSRRLNKLYID